MIVVILMISTAALAEKKNDEDKPTWMRGLVAHYYADPQNWETNWPDTVSIPFDNPKNWTFTKYKYSRVEPTVNHLFVKKGWFSVRWVGYLDITSPNRKDVPMTGDININPNNSDHNEFVLTLPDGDTITRDDLAKGFTGYSGPATKIHLKPKGNGNQNSLTVDGQSYILVNALTHDITAKKMTVNLYYKKGDLRAKTHGHWWISVKADNATIVSSGKRNTGKKGRSAAASDDQSAVYCFSILADDGCRLSIDGQKVIDDWRACWEGSPDALRESKPITLKNGKHKIVIEYFQGQSLVDDDYDPIRLSWTSPSRSIASQIIPPAFFYHTAEELQKLK